MRTSFFILSLFGLLLALPTRTAASNTEMNTIRNRMPIQHLKKEPADSIPSYLKFFSSKLSTSQMGSRQTLDKLGVLALAYHEGHFTGSEKEKIFDILVSSAQNWLDNHPPYSFTATSFDQTRKLGALSLILYKDLQKMAQASEEGAKRAKKLSVSFTAFSHWAWLKGNTIKEEDITPLFDHQRGGNLGYRIYGMVAMAVTSNDTKEMDWIHDHVSRQFPADINREGYHPVARTLDGSRHQHNAGGSQNYLVGYGNDWLGAMLDYGQWTSKTQWGLTKEEYNVMADTYIDGMQWVYSHNQAPYNLCGRHNALKLNDSHAPLEGGKIAAGINRMMQQVTFLFKREPELMAVWERYSKPTPPLIDSTKYFWNSDLMIHQRKDFYIAVKMLSCRTVGCESASKGMDQGRNNFFMGDGSHIIYRDNTEYYKARPAWNWRLVPGITASQKTTPLPYIPWGHNGESANHFAGGVTNGYSGVCGFQYNRTHTEASVRGNKGYYFFNKGMSAAASAISCQDDFPVTTTVDQIEWKETVYVGVKNKVSTFFPGKSFNMEIPKDQPFWIYHNKRGYLFFEGENPAITISGEKRTGSWGAIDGRYEESDKEDVFILQITINHGTKPVNGKYAYSIYPATNKSEIQQEFKNPSCKLLANNPHLSIWKENKDLTGAIFYQPGKVDLPDGVMEAKNPIVFMVDKKGSGKVLANDPLQTQKDGSVKISFKRDNDKSINQKISFKFPQGLKAGKQIQKKIK